jgi:glyoxylase-like metal-dependent hydrolase (beta-lactamase superfamily II)
MNIVEIKPNVFACLMDNVTANAGFVVTDQGVVVIDTLDTPARGRELAAAIKVRNDERVLFIVNTHHHYDHVFGNQAFDAPVVAHCDLAGELSKAAARDLMPVAIAAWISEHPGDQWLADELELVYPSVIFEDRLLLDLKPVRMVVQRLGGHTSDSSIVDLPEEEVLFAGDLVFEGRMPFLRHSHIENTIVALDRLERLGPRTIVPGHGSLCDMDYVTRLRKYLEALRDKVAALMAKGWEKAGILDSDQLPHWWTDDRPDLLRANVERVYEELADH